MQTQDLQSLIAGRLKGLSRPHAGAHQIVSSMGYQRITREQALEVSSQAWEHESVAAEQHNAYQPLLQNMYAGRVRRDFAVGVAAVQAIKSPQLSLLEVGCGSGYYSEVFQHLLSSELRYTGLDYSAEMVSLAKRVYSNCAFRQGSATNLPYEAASFDVVFNGVALMHIVEFHKAIEEAARVAKKAVIFHTVPVQNSLPTQYLQKLAYGRPTVEMIFNEQELLSLFEHHGLIVKEVWESIPYDVSDVLGCPNTTKTFLCEVKQDAKGVETQRSGPLRMVNVGCGSHFHPQMENIDIAPSHPSVRKHNVLAGLPYENDSIDFLYHSHVLEHLPKRDAPAFLAECHRVLKPGGVLRIVVPDLETICRLYLEQLTAARAGTPGAEGKYNWMLMELLDQMSRHSSGGEMLLHWQNPNMPEPDFVLERVGEEARPVIESVRRQPNASARQIVQERDPQAVGHFRLGGEVHQWMYDSYSLTQLLESTGFEAVQKTTATASYVEPFVAFGLDADSAGRTRKPDSLFMEARKRK